MYLEINPYNIDKRLISQAIDVLKNGGLVIYPTDTVYSIGCDMNSKKGLEKLAKWKGEKLAKSKFSIICKDMSEISNYVKQLDRPVFKVLKGNLPGAFTFILNANQELQKAFDSKRNEIGVRIPDFTITQALTEALGNPLVTTSLHNEDDVILDYFIDPQEVVEKHEDNVDLIINGGLGNLYASTVVDLVDGNFEILRQGLGILEK